MGWTQNLKISNFQICEFWVHDATLEPDITCFVCGSDMIDGVLDSVGVPFFQHTKVGSIGVAIVPHFKKEVAKF